MGLFAERREDNKLEPDNFIKRFFAHYYATVMFLTGWVINPIRRRLVSKLTGNILEIGCGPGGNFEFYGPNANVIALEPNETFLVKARTAASKAQANITIFHAAAGDEGLEKRLPQGGVDHIVFSMVLCSIPNPQKAVHDALRYLKPGGKVHVFEHIKSRNYFFGLFQEALQPFWGFMCDGCYLTRDHDHTFSAIKELRRDSYATCSVMPVLMPATVQTYTLVK